MCNLFITKAQENYASASKAKTPDSKKSANIIISGQVKNYYNDEPVLAEIDFKASPFWLSAKKITSNADGTYKISLPTGRHYKYTASSKGYLELEQEIDASRMEYDTEIKTDLYLVPAKKGASIRLEKIFFEYGTSKIKQASFQELNRVVKWMKEHPKIKIEISGHSDSVGSPERNKIRSQERADVVAAYIVSQGIEESRVSSVGYGDKYPAFPNDSEKGRQMNRRVEMKIIEN